MPKSKNTRKKTRVIKAKEGVFMTRDEIAKMLAEHDAKKPPAPVLPAMVSSGMAVPGVPDPDKVMIDLGCGNNKRSGFRGMDKVQLPGVDIVHNLLNFPWPFEDGSVNEFHCSHVMEHFWGEDQILIMDEAYRCLKWDGTLTVIVPAWNSVRMWQDPTHKSPFPDNKAQYFNKEHRVAMGVDHYGIKSDFDFGVFYQILNPGPQSGIKGYVDTSREVQLYAMYYFNNVVGDVTFNFRKVKRAEPLATQALPPPPAA